MEKYSQVTIKNKKTKQQQKTGKGQITNTKNKNNSIRDATYIKRYYKQLM